MTEANLKILVVEDSAEFRSFIIDYMLKPNGFEVVSATNGLEGLKKATTVNPDLILMDYEMPRLDGLELLRKLRFQGLKTPVILMTSHGSEQLAVEVFTLGVSGYLTKPFDIALGLEAIGEALQLANLERERQRLVAEVAATNKKLAAANQELQHQINMMNVLYTIGKSITLIHPSQTLQRILDAALFLTDGEAAWLRLRQPQTGQVTDLAQVKKTGGQAVSPTRHRQISAQLEVQGQKVGTLAVAIPAQTGAAEQAENERLLALLAGYASIALQNLGYLRQIEAQKEREKQAIRAVFEQYVAAPVVNELLRKSKIRLGGARQNVTVLFADLRGFSAFANLQPPEQTIEITNLYLQAAAEAILAEEGTLDKFMGDAVMAFWGAPLPQADHTLRAARAALALKQAAGQVVSGYRLNFGIGLGVGEAVVGNIGTTRLMNYTVIGDCVNKAFRLQENASGGQILVGQELLAVIGPLAVARAVGPLHLKGQRAAEPVFELVGLRAAAPAAGPGPESVARGGVG